MGGSGIGRSNWACISEPDDTNASVVTRGKIWGPVITDSAAGHFAGATHGSNNTGELTAVVESFRWILDRVEKEDKRSVGYGNQGQTTILL